MLSPCLNLTSWKIYSMLFTILRTTIKFWYILWIAEENFGGALYIPSTFINRSWTAVSKDLTRYTKAKKVDRLWNLCMFKGVLILNRPSLHPILVVPPSCNFFYEHIISWRNVHFWRSWISWTWNPLTSLLATFPYLTSLLTLVLERIVFYDNSQN